MGYLILLGSVLLAAMLGGRVAGAGASSRCPGVLS